MIGWELPEKAVLGDREFAIRGDFRQILKILGWLDRQEYHPYVRWVVALALFYRKPIPQELEVQAMEYLAFFISMGHEARPGPRLISWEQDAAMILSDVNAVAGREIRQEAFVHWWTFLSWFHAIGQGQLSTVVGIRHKLAAGQKLDAWERTFYSQNKGVVELKKPMTPEEIQEKQRLETLLEGGSYGAK